MIYDTMRLSDARLLNAYHATVRSSAKADRRDIRRGPSQPRANPPEPPCGVVPGDT